MVPKAHGAARTLGTIAALAIAVVSAAPPARAQGEAPTGDVFDRGLAAMMAGDFEHGCPALRESYRVEPRPGTLFTVAECEAKWGKIASALAHYEEFLSLVPKLAAEQQAKQKKREVVAKKQVADLKRVVPHVLVQSARPIPAGAHVFIDDAELPEGSLGIAVPVDPGAHVVRLRGTSVPFETTVDVKLSETKQVVLAVEAQAPAPPPAAPARVEEDAPKQPSGDSGSSRRTIVFVAGGVGVVALGTGLVTGGLVLGKKSTVDGHCVGNVCDAEGKAAAESGKTLGLVSTITTGVGVVALGAAAVLWLTGPSRTSDASARGARPRPHAQGTWRPAGSVGPGLATVGVEGAF